MKIKKLAEYKGASRFGTCNECGIGESEAHNLYRIQFNQVSICLCADCLKKVKALLNDYLRIVPSAQPEIIRCKDCKHYQFADNRAFGMPVKMCKWFGFEDVDDDDFCSRADKKSDFCPNFGSDNRGEQK